MEIHYINAFIKSVFETFSTMAHFEIARGDLTLAEQARDSRTVVVLIEVTGPVQHSGNTPRKTENLQHESVGSR